MLVLLLILLLQQAPTEVQKQLSEIQKEIAETKVLVKQVRFDRSAQKEVNRQESRTKKLAERRNAGVARIKTEMAEVREANLKLNAKLRAKILADKLAKEQIESPEIRIAREVKLRELLQIPRPTSEEQLIITLAVERNQALEKIARANRRWHCRFLRIGCIGRK